MIFNWEFHFSPIKVKEPITPIQLNGGDWFSLCSLGSQTSLWGLFKRFAYIYSGTDLLAMALEDFMAKYDGSDD